MRVLIITGSYPPDKCGVGDYTFHLAEALAEKPDIEVAVLTSVGLSPSSESSRVKLFRVMANWRIRKLFLAKRFISEFKPDLVHIQYPTQGYNGGLIWLLPLLTRLLLIPVVQTWHEYFVTSGVRWPNLLACKALIYARPDFPQKLPAWVKFFLFKTPLIYVPNISTIPVVTMSLEHIQAKKNELSGGKPIVCFFGFAHINKGMERLFEIVDPEKHQLVLICDLSDKNEYQAKILQMANQAPWIGKVTVTGFQSAQRVGEILAIADAVVFPFPSGAGEWNTSLKASEAAGAFTLATTENRALFGYHENTNTYYAGCAQIVEMKNALSKYIGKRKPVQAENAWGKFALVHKQIYERSLLS